MGSGRWLYMEEGAAECCCSRGDGCLSGRFSFPNERGGGFVEKGEGRLCCGTLGAADAGYELELFLPMTSWMEGRDCRWATKSWSSEVRRDSTGEIIPGAVGGVWPVW